MLAVVGCAYLFAQTCMLHFSAKRHRRDGVAHAAAYTRRTFIYYRPDFRTGINSEVGPRRRGRIHVVCWGGVRLVGYKLPGQRRACVPGVYQENRTRFPGL